jgi:hypothetical protein
MYGGGDLASLEVWPKTIFIEKSTEFSQRIPAGIAGNLIWQDQTITVRKNSGLISFNYAVPSYTDGVKNTVPARSYWGYCFFDN